MSNDDPTRPPPRSLRTPNRRGYRFHEAIWRDCDYVASGHRGFFYSYQHIRREWSPRDPRVLVLSTDPIWTMMFVCMGITRYSSMVCNELMNTAPRAGAFWKVEGQTFASAIKTECRWMLRFEVRVNRFDPLIRCLEAGDTWVPIYGAIFKGELGAVSRVHFELDRDTDGLRHLYRTLLHRYGESRRMDTAMGRLVQLQLRASLPIRLGNGFLNDEDNERNLRHAPFQRIRPAQPA